MAIAKDPTQAGETASFLISKGSNVHCLLSKSSTVVSLGQGGTRRIPERLRTEGKTEEFPDPLLASSRKSISICGTRIL